MTPMWSLALTRRPRKVGVVCNNSLRTPSMCHWPNPSYMINTIEMQFAKTARSLAYSFTHSLTSSLTHSLTHSINQSITHSLTHVLVYSIKLSTYGINTDQLITTANPQNSPPLLCASQSHNRPEPARIRKMNNPERDIGGSPKNILFLLLFSTLF